MYTEIDVSEFLIRARLKLGDLAIKIKEQTQIGGDIQELVNDATELRMFLNAVNSHFQTWGLIDLYKRIEYFTERFDLANKPIYAKDWLDKFKPVSQLVIKNAITLKVPKGTGYMYVDNGTARLITDEKLNLNDI